jgi:hypothetical protein
MVNSIRHTHVGVIYFFLRLFLQFFFNITVTLGLTSQGWILYRKDQDAGEASRDPTLIARSNLEKHLPFNIFSLNGMAVLPRRSKFLKFPAFFFTRIPPDLIILSRLLLIPVEDKFASL